MAIKLKRVYEPPADHDGYRVLVDRLWPRGLPEESAHIDLWLRRVAPTTELRTWYGHDVDRWPEFQDRYREELSEHGDLLGLIRDIERHRKVVTLLFGAKDESHNEANVLLDMLKNNRGPEARRMPRDREDAADEEADRDHLPDSRRGDAGPGRARRG